MNFFIQYMQSIFTISNIVGAECDSISEACLEKYNADVYTESDSQLLGTGLYEYSG